MDNMQKRIWEGCEKLLYDCAGVKKNDVIFIITDDKTKHLGDHLFEVSASISNNVSTVKLNQTKMHGEEPPLDVASKMLTSDVIFCLTTMSMAHTQARLNANNNGAKYLSLPDYNIDVLTSNALQTDYKKLTNTAELLGEYLNNGNIVNINSEKGTDLQIQIKDRKANIAPGWCDGTGTLASPPDAEVNIASIENKSNGIIVVDGSIPCNEIGLLTKEITLTIENGSVVDIRGELKDVLEELFNNSGSEKSRIIGEFGIGLNPNAELCGLMLPDEGCLGTVHFGIGSNHTIGGKNKVSFHLDHIIKNPSVLIDGLLIMDEGTLII